MRPLRTLLAAAALAAAAAVPALAQGPIENAEFAPLLAGLGSEDFATRERSEDRLTKLAAASRLRPAHVRAIQDAVNGPNLEVAMRADRVFQRFLPTMATYRELFAAAELRELAPVMLDAAGDEIADGRFQFDGATGRFGGPGTNSNIAYGVMVGPWLDASQALARGDAGGAAAALDRLRAIVAAQPPFRIGLLQLRSRATGLRLDQDALLAQIDQARAIIPLLRQELRNNGLDPDPAPPMRGALNAPGPLPIGASLVLAAAAVPAPGSLDAFSPVPEHARAALPATLAYVSPVYDLVAMDGLLVADSVHLALQFSRLLGHPDRYRILRVANAEYDLLPLDGAVDLGARLVTGSYLAGSAGTDQFGSFAVVQTVPEPAPAWLLVGGVGALAGVGLVRRRVGNPSSRRNRRGRICGCPDRLP